MLANVFDTTLCLRQDECLIIFYMEESKRALCMKYESPEELINSFLQHRACALIGYEQNRNIKFITIRRNAHKTEDLLKIMTFIVS